MNKKFSRGQWARKVRVIVVSVVAILGGLVTAPGAAGEAAPTGHATARQAPVVTASGLVLVPPPPPVTADGRQLRGTWTGPYRFVNLNSNKCLEMGYEQTQNLAQANQWACIAPWTQQMWWTWQAWGDGGVSARFIANVHSRKCLDIWNFSMGAAVVQMPCVGLENQIWTATSSIGIQRNFSSSMCMEVAGGDKRDGALILQWDCHGQSHQVWAQYVVT